MHPAGETRYVTDLIFTPIRTGPGGDYRIINKGLPSGTEVMYYGTTEDGVWAEVETRGGTRGYLEGAVPANRHTSCKSAQCTRG